MRLATSNSWRILVLSIFIFCITALAALVAQTQTTVLTNQKKGRRKIETKQPIKILTGGVSIRVSNKQARKLLLLKDFAVPHPRPATLPVNQVTNLVPELNKLLEPVPESAYTIEPLIRPIAGRPVKNTLPDIDRWFKIDLPCAKEIVLVKDTINFEPANKAISKKAKEALDLTRRAIEILKKAGFEIVKPVMVGEDPRPPIPRKKRRRQPRERLVAQPVPPTGFFLPYKKICQM